MDTTIEIDHQTAEALMVRAQERGMTLDAFLRSVAGLPEPESAPATNGVTQTAEEFNALLDEFFEQNPRRLPSLPPDFSRADIYAEHD